MKRKAKESVRGRERPVTVTERAGLAAMERTGATRVFVTGDGQSFLSEAGARSHAANLRDGRVTEVRKEDIG